MDVDLFINMYALIVIVIGCGLVMAALILHTARGVSRMERTLPDIEAPVIKLA
jgi:hypothetical protein